MSPHRDDGCEASLVPEIARIIFDVVFLQEGEELILIGRLTLFRTPNTMIETTSVGRGHGDVSFQSSLRDAGHGTISLPSDESLGYYHSALRGEQPTTPPCDTFQESTL